MSKDDTCPHCRKLERELLKLKTINRVLVERVEHSMDLEGDSYNLFQAAIALEDKVHERTAALQKMVASLNAANDALKAANQKAEQAVEAKSKFLARMSHELRTPLNAILGFGQLMQEDEDEPLSAKHADYQKTVLKAGEHLLGLINEVLDLARIDAGKTSIQVEDVDARVVLQECLALLRPVAAQSRVEFTIEGEESLTCYVKADRVRLKQVLINLLSNAIKYNKEGGRVVLRCNVTNNNRVHFGVSDEGQGIAPHEYKQIFEPFERLPHHEEIRGSGIGLAVSRQLVELMGGEISVTSVPGRGSTFCFELPLGQNVPITQKLGLATNEQNPLAEEKKYTLLYVEDKCANLELMSEIIKRRQDIQFLTAQTASSGLDIAITYQPDLILLDINLPDMDGNELLRLILQHKKTGHIPVVAVSADAMQQEIEKALQNGFKKYLTKPIDITELNSVISHYLIAEEYKLQLES